MALNIPTTQQIKDKVIAFFETAINQTIPLLQKAFLRVEAGVDAMLFTMLYKFASERTKQSLALTATGADLDRIGNNYGVTRKLAQAAINVATLPATTGTVIELTNDFFGDLNNVRYLLSAQVTAVADVATLTLTAQELGTIGNLSVSDTLTIGTQVAGILSTTATVSSITQLGTEKETDDDYRVRILDVTRATCGGGNAADYRIWAQETEGVVRAFPYAGNPTDLAIDDGSSYPPQRTVYVEASTDIDPDGLAPGSLLDDVRDTITTDPETGKTRQPLGLTDDTLFVESITRTSIFMKVSGLTVDSAIEAQVKTEIETALTTYLYNIDPFIDGLDPEFDRDDLITDPIVSGIVQDVVQANGGSITAVQFGTAPAVFLASYRLSPGEKVKNAGVAYA